TCRLPLLAMARNSKSISVAGARARGSCRYRFTKALTAEAEDAEATQAVLVDSFTHGGALRPCWGVSTMAYPTTFKYTKDHEWIEVSGDRGKVGITDYAQKQLGDVVYLELPAIGAKLTQGQSFGTIESVKAVSELYAPVSGEVVEVNDALKNKPEQ